ncbi:MAG: hypothetical protein U0X39_14980 [Bacteroidales bacterium]
MTPEKLRFDFSHYSRLSKEELLSVEKIVNNLCKREHCTASIIISRLPAKEMVPWLFGEKYGDRVRVVRSGNSIELCGGTHVENTGKNWSVQDHFGDSHCRGVRRIEAVTAGMAESYINAKLDAVVRSPPC